MPTPPPLTGSTAGAGSPSPGDAGEQLVHLRGALLARNIIAAAHARAAGLSLSRPAHPAGRQRLVQKLIPVLCKASEGVKFRAQRRARSGAPCLLWLDLPTVSDWLLWMPE